MIDKTLLLKGVAGVATLGGVGGAGFLFKDQIGSAISGSSAENSVDKAGDRQETGRNNLGTDKQGSRDTNLTDNQDPKPGASEQGVGAGGGTKVSSTSTTVSTVDEQGIPNKCTAAGASTPCELEENDLKKIKFETLEGGEGEVEVEGYPTDASKKITLTIDSTDTSKKKYIFSNTSDNDVKIKKGSGGSEKTVTLKSGKTKFTLNDKKLKQFTLGDYNIPSDCNSTCTLTSSDLEDISFKVLDGGAGNITVTPNTGTVSLEIKDVESTKRYIFSNSSNQDVTIKKGEGKTVTFASNKKTQFTPESDNKKLSKLELDNYGVPSSCSNSCTLTADDLGEIKFEELEGTGTVSPTNQTISLKVDSSDTADKRFTFDNSSGSSITIQKPTDNSKKITLSAGKTRFKVSSEKLKEIKLNSYGLPQDCNSSCKLTADDLKEIKFKNLEGGSGDVTFDPANPNPSITLSIGTSSPKIYTFKNTGSKLTLKKGSDVSKTIVLETGDTEFTEESNKLVSYEDPALKTVNEKIGKLKLPEECKFKNNEKIKTTKECEVTKEDLKKVEFSNKDDGQESNIETSISGKIKLEIRKLKSSDDVDTEQYGSGINDGDLRITFKDTSSKITIGSGSNNTITIPAKSNMEFLVNNSNKLNRSYDDLNTLPTGIKVACTSGSNDCTPSEGLIRILSGDNLDKCQEINNLNTSTAIFTVVKDTENYNLGYKFTVSSNPGTSSLNANDTYEIKYSKSQKKWGFVKKNGG